MIETEKRKEKMWTKSFLNAIKDDSEWYEHWNSMDISIHSVEIISILSNKKTLNDNEKSVLDFAFELAYPNGLQDQIIYNHQKLNNNIAVDIKIKQYEYK